MAPKKLKSDWFTIREDLDGIDKFDHALKRFSECKCGRSYEFYSQVDDKPEYYTEITLVCECGKYIIMEFPVN
jgi:hypothetical protein